MRKPCGRPGLESLHVLRLPWAGTAAEPRFHADAIAILVRRPSAGLEIWGGCKDGYCYAFLLLRFAAEGELTWIEIVSRLQTEQLRKALQIEEFLR